MASATGSEVIRSHLHLDGIAGQSKIDIVNLISKALLEPMQDHSLLETLPPFSDDPVVLKLSALEVCNELSALDPQKVGGPDAIPN